VTPSKNLITQQQVKRAEYEMYNARADRERAETRRATLIADEIQDERDRKHASSDAHRVFPFYTQVTGGSVRACVESLAEWSRLPDAKTLPFTIEITSPGGTVFDGLALFDYVRNLQSRGFVVNTYGTGLIASMATVLMQMGTNRAIGANSWFMIHELSDFVIGNLSEIEDGAKVGKRINDRLNAILAERSTLTKAQIRTRSLRKDWYLTAEETVALGFADELR
jgi:ATP-dependent protease ClpP protease subunit